MENVKIIQINTKQIKEMIITECDTAFDNHISKRNNYEELVNKINNYAEFYAAQYKNKYVGFAAMYNNDSINNIAYITLIGVLKEYQNMHIGSQLIDTCFKNAIKRGKTKIKLQVNPNNSKAINFYKYKGFSFEDEHNENLYMSKNL